MSIDVTKLGAPAAQNNPVTLTLRFESETQRDALEALVAEAAGVYGLDDLYNTFRAAQTNGNLVKEVSRG